MMPNVLRALRSLVPPPPTQGEDGVEAAPHEPVSAAAFVETHGAPVLETLELGGLVQRDEFDCLHVTAAGAARLG